MKEGWYCAHILCKYFKDCNEPRFLEPNCRCLNARRKHETPEQFKERTGREYPDGGAVYHRGLNTGDWNIASYQSAKKLIGKAKDFVIIVSNTDFGPPKSDFEVGL
ncbi:hypothetical protein AGMMS50268_21270 [Spirochaetia bacterium]|nr:hypothetical protein AGMMS50268_21270 [Spirochaetia bacterium]